MLRRFCTLFTSYPRRQLSWAFQCQQQAAATRHAASAQPPYAQPQPLTRAVGQLEQMVSDSNLPKEALAANEAALATLKSFLEGLANPLTYPKAGIQNVQFSVWRGNRVQRIRCQLKTTGGDCSRLVATTLGDMFAKMGFANPDIYFDRDEFQPGADQEPAPEEVASVRAKAAAAGFPSQTITGEQFRELEARQQAQREGKDEKLEEADGWQAKLKHVDPLFAAVAAVPWMPTDEDDGQRRRYIQTRVLDELEAQGWDIRGAVHRLWRGEREVRQLAAGKDAGSQAAIQSLAYHAKQFDEKYGRRTLQDVGG